MFRIRVKRFAVADHLEFQPVRLQRFACEFRRQHCISRSVTAGRIRQDEIRPTASRRPSLHRLEERDAADRDRHDLGPARPDRVQHDLAVRIRRTADQQSGVALSAIIRGSLCPFAILSLHFLIRPARG